MSRKPYRLDQTKKTGALKISPFRRELFEFGAQPRNLSHSYQAMTSLVPRSRISTEKSSLTKVLTDAKNDSSLVVFRNALHKSLSSPCFSPLKTDLEDETSFIEVLRNSDNFSFMKQIAKDIKEAMKMGIEPVAVNGGLGGVYCFKNINGENVAIVKPIDEEPFALNNPKGYVGKAPGRHEIKLSGRVGETGYREVMAYLLDKDNFAKVPPTALVKITHSIFNINGDVKPKVVRKIASLQQFVPHDYDACEHGTSSFPVSDVHRIGILDIRIFNIDRHSGNILVKVGKGRFDEVKLVPIDHGLCLPETLQDPFFEWMHWPQASIPFSEDELKYIAKLDPFEDCEMLKKELPMVRQASLRLLVLCTILLKEAAVYGLCLSEIGEMMTREIGPGDDKPSELEVVCIDAKNLIEEIQEDETDFPRSLRGDDDDDEFLFQIDGVGNIRSHLSKIKEGDKDEEEEEEKEEESANSSSGHKGAEEQKQESTSFVKLSDMSEETWTIFLKNYQEMLKPAIAKRRSTTLARKMKPRFGTCGF